MTYIKFPRNMAETAFAIPGCGFCKNINKNSQLGAISRFMLGFQGTELSKDLVVEEVKRKWETLPTFGKISATDATVSAKRLVNKMIKEGLISKV